MDRREFIRFAGFGLAGLAAPAFVSRHVPIEVAWEVLAGPPASSTWVVVMHPQVYEQVRRLVPVTDREVQ